MMAARETPEEIERQRKRMLEIGWLGQTSGLMNLCSQLAFSGCSPGEAVVEVLYTLEERATLARGGEIPASEGDKIQVAVAAIRTRYNLEETAP